MSWSQTYKTVSSGWHKTGGCYVNGHYTDGSCTQGMSTQRPNPIMILVKLRDLF